MKLIKYALISIFLFLLLLGYFFYIDTNFFVVDEGNFYRSGQLSKKEFEKVIDEYKIKTIVNLRDMSPEKTWFKDEVEIAKAHGITHISVGMSARRIPHRYEVKALLEAYDKLEKPILIHCRNGSDRSGIADALYRMEVLGQNSSEVKSALSPKYLHFPFLRPQPSYFLELYKNRRHFEEEYFPCRKNFAYFSKKKYCSGKGEPLSIILNSAEYTQLRDGPLKLFN